MFCKSILLHTTLTEVPLKSYTFGFQQKCNNRSLANAQATKYQSFFFRSLMYKLHCSIRFHRSPRRAKIKVPNFLNSRLQQYVALHPLSPPPKKVSIVPPVGQESRKSIPPVSAARFPPVSSSCFR